MLLAVTLIRQLSVQTDVDTDVVRGGDTKPVLIVSDPQATIEILTKHLAEVGAEFLPPVQINDQELSLQIDVSSKVDVSAINNILTNNGLRVEGLPPYHRLVKKKS